MEPLGKYVDTEGGEWQIVQDDDGALVVTDTDGGVRIPVVGTLSSATRPEDFARFAARAAHWRARRQIKQDSPLGRL